MKNIKILFNKFLRQEEGISLVASITFNLVTLLLATSWAYFASSQFDTTVLKIEGIRNTYLLKGYNSLVRAVKPNIDWGKAQYLAGFNITYNPSSFIPNADNYNGLGNVNIEKVQSDGGTD
ncbi:hypothetical protein IT568_04120, partial [bacterium]|nr:hypothetical protein [bacterium]